MIVKTLQKIRLQLYWISQTWSWKQDCSLIIFVPVWCPGKLGIYHPRCGTKCMWTPWKLHKHLRRTEGSSSTWYQSNRNVKILNSSSSHSPAGAEIFICASIAVIIFLIFGVRWYIKKNGLVESLQLTETRNIFLKNIKPRKIAVISESV